MSSKTPLPSHFGRVTAIAGDHLQLLQRVTELTHLASSVREREPEAREVREIQVRCEELQASMARHFAAEEANSYFGVLMAEQPSACSSIVELCAQHAEMLHTLEECLANASALLGGERRDPRELADQLELLAERLQMHESVESALMQDFLLGARR